MLLVPAGYNQFPCHSPLFGPAEVCIIFPNPFVPIALESLILATVPVVCIFDFRAGFRAGGIVAMGAVLFLILGTLFIWHSSYTWAGQTISTLSTSPPWSPVLKLGATLVGAGLVVLGSLIRVRR